MSDELIVGMSSSTSYDGVDAVLVHFSDTSMDLLHALCAPYPAAIKLTLDQLLETGEPPAGKVAQLLDENLAYFFARVAQDLVREAGLEMRDIHAIGSDGQNAWCQPQGDPPVTMQLGRGDLIARNTGTTVVNNFRAADLEAGGQGAPLASLLHQELFRSETENRAILNLGGIANLTILPAQGAVAGFDCGPGNCLMDGWTSRQLQKNHDDQGRWAAKGEIDKGLLMRMLKDPYFERPYPKSTGLEYFNTQWLDQMLGQTAPAAVDVQATLAELTVQGITRSLAESGLPERLLVCGGGVHNSFLMHRISAALPDVVVESTSVHGADPDWVEGLLFAWLAHERLFDRAQSTGAITGAGRPVLLGDIHEPKAV
jgi:anhydro-N-acetylmuramic acid kinase